ncbi:toll/interleukin-1 receptor domain-containing protein [Bacteroides sp. An269]|uniref:toll/interleukin-1 receptor domain-containing protein n=1 Tax=Bacteroides sp. An269 TaxID=1965613 RepID=UPI000B382B26|nr:toll/interleukin-1 receptor domain-containing protein [Bacteroides sp. An269]OUO77839.1 hypothetical protein B5F71_08695 [Bacteroides sp. An269]
MLGLNRYYLNESYDRLNSICIFISHQKKDSSDAKKIADYLMVAELDVYFDEYDQNIDRSNPYSVVNAIKVGLKRSTHLLCIISQNSLESKWVPWEIGYAYDNKILVGLTLRDLSKSFLPEYLQVIQILRDTKSLNEFIAQTLKSPSDRLVLEGRMRHYYDIQSPLWNVLDMRLFVSYTLKDGYLDTSLLLKVKELYKNCDSCYIDIIDNDSIDKQGRVEQELQSADALLLIETPMAMQSKWVKYELDVAKKRNIVIIKSDINKIKREICKHR